jgi:TolB-like protein/Tfp pilus assembly protein PilF
VTGSNEVSGAAVRQQLETILLSRTFLKAESLAKLLRFIVEQELDGNRDRLREQIIAEEAFGRRNFDPQADTIVRSQARRLRQRLMDYYDTEGRAQPISIVLEKGSYVPAFRRVRPAPAGDVVSDSSIVVLPFLNLTGLSSQEYFSDGLTEEIITALSKVRRLKVVARTSAFAFKNREADVREIGRRLGVAAVLEGSVRTSGDRLRVTAQLIDCKTGFHLWSENYDREQSDIFEVQSEIADSILRTLVRSAPPSTVRHKTTNMEAYHLFLRAIYEFFRVTADSIPRCTELLRQAIAIDPDFAAARAFQGMTLVAAGWWGMAPSMAVFPQARQLANEALALDPQCAEARLALAIIRFAFDHDIDGSLDEFDDLLEFSPGYAFARLGQAYALLAARRFDEAMESARQAHELDPLSVIYVYNRGVVAHFAQRWDEAERFARAAAQLVPEFAESYILMGGCLMEARRFDEAIPLMEKAISMNATIGLEILPICYCRMGRFDDAEVAFNRLVELARHTYVAPHRFALAASAFPDTGRVFDYLEAAWKEHDARLIWLRSWPLFDHLHSDPRFVELSRRLRLI